MKTSDKIASVIVLGLPVPVLLMLAGWWGSVPFISQNSLIFFLALAGFILGVVLDLTLLRHFIFRLFTLPLAALFAVAAFYSVMIYGFFMGFPVFNSLIGIVGTYIVVRKGLISLAPREAILTEVRKMYLFSFILLFLFCVSTAILSLREVSITSQLEGMLSLPFEVTPLMVWLLILIGGAFLLAFQFIASKLLCRHMLKNT